MTMPVLGRPSLEESYQSLANWSCIEAKQGEIKGVEAVLLPER